jgi:hypothetical protein
MLPALPAALVIWPIDLVLLLIFSLGAFPILRCERLDLRNRDQGHHNKVKPQRDGIVRYVYESTFVITSFRGSPHITIHQGLGASDQMIETAPTS